MQRTSVSEGDARHVLDHVLQQAWVNDLSKPRAERLPTSPRTCGQTNSAPLQLPPPQQQQQQQLHAFPRLTQTLSPHALANLQTMLSQRPLQKAVPGTCPNFGGPPSRSAYESPPESPTSRDDADGEDTKAGAQQQVDLSRGCFDSQCAHQTGTLPAASLERAMAAPLFLRGGEVAGGATYDSPPLRPITVPPPRNDLRLAAHSGAASPGLVGEGLMEVTLQPGMSSIVDLKSRCTDGLLLLSTTTSFVPRALRAGC